MVYTEPVDPNADDPTMTLVGAYPTSSTSNLSGVSVHGHVLTLQDESGSTYAFDLDTLAYQYVI